MSKKFSHSALRLVVALLLAGALVSIASAVWLIATDQGAPIWIALAGAMMAALASIFASQIKKKG